MRGWFGAVGATRRGPSPGPVRIPVLVGVGIGAWLGLPGAAGAGTEGSGDDQSWFSQAFEQNSILWLLIASTIGGVIGATIKFVFDDLASPMLSHRRQERRVFRSYLPGLLKDSEAAEQRLTLLVRTVDRHWYDDDEYFRLYTLYQIGSFLARVHLIEVEVGFLPPGGAGRKSTGRFNDSLYGPFNGFTSFQPFGTDYSIDELDRSQVPRGMLKAIGEAMTTGDDAMRPIDFTEFVGRCAHPEFQRWFRELDGFMRDLGPEEASRWDRLIVAAAEFRLLARRLDPKGQMVRLRPPANLDLLNSQSAREFIEERWLDTTGEPLPPDTQAPGASSAP